MTKNQQFRHLKKNYEKFKRKWLGIVNAKDFGCSSYVKKYSKKLINLLPHLKYIKSAFAEYFHDATWMMTVSFGDKYSFMDKFTENQKCCINKGKSEQSYKLNEILNVNINYGCKYLPNSQINSLPR